MFFSELLGGLAIILYNKLNFMYRKKKSKQDEVIVKILTKGKGRKMSKSDHMFKIIVLIFFAAFFDYVQFIISYTLGKIAVLSPTSDQRLRIVITMVSSLLCTYALKFKIDLRNLTVDNIKHILKKSPNIRTNEEIAFLKSSSNIEENIIKLGEILSKSPL